MLKIISKFNFSELVKVYLSGLSQANIEFSANL